MDRQRKEISALENAVNEAMGDCLRELDEIQLALVGGGCGDPILA